ncbi:MAG: ATP-binding cassette domain-containing protein [Acholeplasmataceae bacterium]
MTYAILTDNLVKDYQGLKAVNQLNLKVPVGAIYGFLGPNGSGKTTTLKMLTGMTKPTSGTIEILGKAVVFGKNESQLDVGFLPDVPGFYDWMNAKEFLMFCGRLFGLADDIIKKRVADLLATVGLTKSAHKRIGTYSRGMKQRLGIAQALINDPAIIFLDEPVSALDPQGRKEVMDIISKLAGKVTVFFSTHILADVERICDRVVIIKDGVAILEDTIENIKQMTSKRTIDIEFESNHINQMTELLKDKPFIEDINQNGLVLSLDVTDLVEARHQLHKIIYDSHFLIKKMIVREPSLEEIYLEVVNHQ